MGFVPGSIAATFASSDARTFQEPPKEWLPTGAAGNQSTWYAGAPHSLVGDLIREGATGVSGHVTEPYLQSVVRPQILFGAYLAGFNLAEAFHLALPYLSWQTVVIGDPLCTPFPRKAPASTDLAPDSDGRTELPRFFSARRLDTLKATIKSQPEALALLIQAETQSARGHPDRARAALTRAVTLDPRLTAAHLQLALLDEQAGRTDAAMSGYRRVLELDPQNVAALNNLAYTLSVVMKQPAEAKSYAERAMAAAPRDPLVLDTLGWIEYLLGNHAAALKLLSAAAIAAPTNAEVRLHTAFAADAAGAPGAAASELKAALALDRRLEERQDVRELRTRLERALK
jgi:tetratricopeptide (TPR) repeat protein